MLRRDFLGSVVASTATFAAPAVRAAGLATVLRYVPQADLALLDPGFTPALVTRNHAYLVYDTLYGIDDAGQPQPQMARGHAIENDGTVWTITLREGLRFHDGEKVLARDVAASLRRWGSRDVYAISVFAQIYEIAAVSDDVLQIRLKRPFRLLADLLCKPTPLAPAIMPERLARTEPAQQVMEIIGSGPYRFVMGERVPGSLAVYDRFTGYVPRPYGVTSFTSGPKIAYFDRVEWHTIPDPSTAATALQSGEMDWLEQAAWDLLPLLRKRSDIVVDVLDTFGLYALLRFNHLNPPFDNAAIRRALLGAFSQTDMMTAIVGENRAMWQAGVGFFHPASPLASDAGMEVLTGPRNLARVRHDLQEAGYQGERVVFLVPIDLPASNAMSEVAGDLMRRLGINLDYQLLDWGTVAQRLNSKQPLDRGGWSVIANYVPGFVTMNPAAHPPLRGTGQTALLGWPSMPRVEELRSAWIDATDPAEQKRLAREIQLQAFEDVPYIPLGLFYQAAAYRRGLEGLLKGGIPLFYNVRRS
jgi:peptide/nickel transport system substrate-binding protein